MTLLQQYTEIIAIDDTETMLERLYQLSSIGENWDELTSFFEVAFFIQLYRWRQSLGSRQLQNYYAKEKMNGIEACADLLEHYFRNDITQMYRLALKCNLSDANFERVYRWADKNPQRLTVFMAQLVRNEVKKKPAKFNPRNAQYV